MPGTALEVLRVGGWIPPPPFQMSLKSESLTRSIWYMCLELATKLIFSFRKLTENNLLPRAKARVCDEPWNLWIQRGCGADLPGRLGTWSSDGFATSNPNWRWVKEIHKNDRLSELMYSEEAQTFYFKTLPRSIGDHVVAAEHLPCFSYPPVTRFAGKGVNSYLSAGFILPTIFFFFFFPNPVWKSKRIQKVWNASLVRGGGGICSNSRWDVIQLDLDGFFSPPGSGLGSVPVSWIFFQVLIFACC